MNVSVCDFCQSGDSYELIWFTLTRTWWGSLIFVGVAIFILYWLWIYVVGGGCQEV